MQQGPQNNLLILELLVIYAVANDGLRLEIPECPFGKLIADCWVEPDEGPNCDEILSRLLDYENTLP
ncbi:hypothetical protein AAG906_028953 [Vitis piasezkii]